MPETIYVDPGVTASVIKVDGKCYRRATSSDHEPEVFPEDIQGIYCACEECACACVCELVCVQVTLDENNTLQLGPNEGNSCQFDNEIDHIGDLVSWGRGVYWDTGDCKWHIEVEMGGGSPWKARFISNEQLAGHPINVGETVYYLLEETITGTPPEFIALELGDCPYCNILGVPNYRYREVFCASSYTVHLVFADGTENVPVTLGSDWWEANFVHLGHNYHVILFYSPAYWQLHVTYLDGGSPPPPRQYQYVRPQDCTPAIGEYTYDGGSWVPPALLSASLS